MRFLLFLLLAPLLTVRAETTHDPLAGAPEPLREAVRKAGADLGRWAYTMHTHTRDRKGRVTEDTVARFDPSQHYDVQWTLLTKEGRPATESEIRQHRRQRAKLTKNRKTLGELLELNRAVLVPDALDAPGILTYAVPMSREGNDRFPVDKVEVLIRVRAEQQVLEREELKVLEPIRAMLVAKLKSAGVRMDFTPVHPDHGPALTRIRADLGAAVAFMPVEQHTEQTRTDFKRVTPYDERFQVRIGPLKAIDF